MYRAAVKDAVPRLASFFKTLAAMPNVATLPVYQTAGQELFATSPLRFHVGNSIGRVRIFGQHLNGSAHRQFHLSHLNQQLLQIPAAMSNVRTQQILRTCAFQASVDNSIGHSLSTHPIAYGTVREQHSSATPQPVEGASVPQAAKMVQSESGGGGGQKSDGDGGARKGFFANLQDVPLVPLLLGFAGAIPFVALAPPVAPLLPLPVSFLKAFHTDQVSEVFRETYSSHASVYCGGTKLELSAGCNASGFRRWFQSNNGCVQPIQIVVQKAAGPPCL
jgi:hypothetical protein